jgi:hypothetical protein
VCPDVCPGTSVGTKRTLCRSVVSKLSYEAGQLLISALIAGHINPFKPKLVYTIFKESVCTSKRTPHLTIIKANPLTLFKEIIDAYSQNGTETVNRKNADLTEC